MKLHMNQPLYPPRRTPVRRRLIQPLLAASTLAAGGLFWSLLVTQAFAQTIGLTHVGEWPGVKAGGPAAVAIQDTFAYVAAYSGGLVIMDLRDLANPVRTGGFDTGGSVESVAVSGDFACIIDAIYEGDAWRHRFMVLDISDPTEPSLKSSLALAPGDKPVAMSARGSKAYVALSGQYDWQTDRTTGAGLSVIDISDPAAAREVGRYAIGTVQGGLLWRDNLAITENHAYLATGINGLHVIDLADPTNPRRVGSYNGDGYVHHVYVSGLRAYVYDANGLSVLDISNPTVPRRVGGFRGGIGHVMFVCGSYVYLWYSLYSWTSESPGLHVVDFTVPSSPVLVTTYPNATFLWRDLATSAVTEDVGYLISGEWIEAIDLSDPSQPRQLARSRFDLGWSRPQCLAVDSKRALLVDAAGLQILDVSQPGNPVRVGWHEIDGFADGTWLGAIVRITIEGDRAYLTALWQDTSRWYTQRLKIIDVSNPAAPVTLSTYDLGSVDEFAIVDYVDVAVAGDYAYVASVGSGLEVIDISNPARPLPAGWHQASGAVKAVAIHGSHAYLGLRRSWDGSQFVGETLEIIDISDPFNPRKVGGFSILDPEGRYQELLSLAVSGKCVPRVLCGATGHRRFGSDPPASRGAARRRILRAGR
jgi:hypothetical protein